MAEMMEGGAREEMKAGGARREPRAQPVQRPTLEPMMEGAWVESVVQPPAVEPGDLETQAELSRQGNTISPGGQGVAEVN